MKKKDSIYSAELIVDDLADGLPDAATPTLSHYDETGRACMVDVSAKAATRREAVAAAFVELSEAVLAALPQNPKGNPQEVARLAGVPGGKQNRNLNPVFNPPALSFVDVKVRLLCGSGAVQRTSAA